jgi:hypothetical protein
MELLVRLKISPNSILTQAINRERPREEKLYRKQKKKRRRRPRTIFKTWPSRERIESEEKVLSKEIETKGVKTISEIMSTVTITNQCLSAAHYPS